MLFFLQMPLSFFFNDKRKSLLTLRKVRKHHCPTEWRYMYHSHGFGGTFSIWAGLFDFGSVVPCVQCLTSCFSEQELRGVIQTNSIQGSVFIWNMDVSDQVWLMSRILELSPVYKAYRSLSLVSKKQAALRYTCEMPTPKMGSFFIHAQKGKEILLLRNGVMPDFLTRLQYIFLLLSFENKCQDLLVPGCHSICLDWGNHNSWLTPM